MGDFLEILGELLGGAIRLVGGAVSDNVNKTLSDFGNGLDQAEDMSTKEVIDGFLDEGNSLGERAAYKKELKDRGIIE